MKKFPPTYLPILLLSFLVMAACGRPSSRKLETAERIAEDHPDSARAILRHIDYFYLDEEGKARYIMAKATSDAATGRSLVTDSLLPVAVRFYKQQGDTPGWLKANKLYISYLYELNRIGAASEVVGEILTSIPADDIDHQSQFRDMGLQLHIAAEKYGEALKEADWLIDHAESDRARLGNAQIRMFLLLKLGGKGHAAAYGDSILRSSFAPTAGSPEWLDFMGDYAEILDEDRQSAKAVAVVENILALNPDMSPETKATYMISLAKYYANLGDISRARHILTAIDSLGYDPLKIEAGFGRDVEFLHNALDYRETGHLSLLSDKTTAAEVYRRRIINNDAISEMNELSAWKMQLTLEKQNVAILLLSFCLLLTIVAAIFYRLSSRRRRRLLEAEEKIDTLDQMLREVRSADGNSADRNRTLKRMVLRQMGLLKVFASSPTEQNQEVLRKISAVDAESASNGNLVNWEHLYAMIDELYEGFYTNLLKTYPDTFSEKEIQIICLLHGGFSTKEIGVLTRQSSATIYVRKSAIRKKLGTEEGGDFLAAIIAATTPSDNI